jgi:glycosyltransferase involved in cell wall biosynthesis
VVRRLRILFIGSNIFPARHPGDKTFWLDLFEWLKSEGHEIEVLSITSKPDVSWPAGYSVVRPILIALPDRTSRYNPGNRWRSASTNYLSKSLTFPILLGELRKAARGFRPDIVHFIDNYGPVMSILPLVKPIARFTVSCPTYNPRAPLYDRFLRMSLRPFDAIAPYSNAFAHVLDQMGFPAARIVPIRWGVDLERCRPPSAAERSESRVRLHLQDDQVVVAWTGFIQQTNWSDFQFSLRVAQLVTAREPSRFAFAFCFKPEHFRAYFRQWEAPGIRVLGNTQEFEDLRRSADYLLSPILAGRSTAAPPLTWLEFLAMGVPLISTPLRGSREVLLSGTNGWVVHSPEEARDRLLGIGGDPERLRRMHAEARRLAEERLGIIGVGRRFVELWSELVTRTASAAV